ncbi:hypothetical protein FPZ12_012320 [Amycolatopsis acidicola]|uniref:Condensation domain-containing protein n=1 Tax=Amycolatopsis acidicola TaxID=2596893 RepID=A0A5N0VBN0_9PSEU|nr:condensation domain-containing protein [Amycolatopsis acidicola]KAA9162022.1 hypothetical protein FPZ12_012320 [Amycolatopsis acidicola]
MILSDMSTWKAAPGRLVRWRPTDAARSAAEAAPVDPGPPSILQADHLRAWAHAVRTGTPHRAWTGIATTVDGPLDRAAMTRALARLVRAHGGFRTWFDLSGREPVRHLVPADAIEFEVVEEPALDGAWDTALQHHLEARFDAECTPGSWPGFALGVVENQDRFGLFWGCDHAFTDGLSQLLLCSELADLYAAELAEPGGPELVPGALPTPEERGDFRSYVALERRDAEEHGPDSPEVREWVRIVRENGGRLPRFPLPLGLADGERAPVVIRELTFLDGDEVERFERVCREAGAGVTAGVFAAVAETERLLAGKENYFGVTVLSTRHRGPFARSQGWFCTFAPIAFEVGGAADFGELTARAQDALRRAKDLAAAPVNVVLETLVTSGVCTPEQLGSPQLLSYLDLRRLPGAGRPADERGVHFTSRGRTANASLWINRDADHLYLLAQTPDTAAAAEPVRQYHEQLRQVFRQAVSPVPVA